MNMLQKSLTSHSLIKNKKLVESGLVNETFKVVFHNSLKSVDVEPAEFRNYIDIKNDGSISNQIKRLLFIENKLITDSDLPIMLDEFSDDHYLVRPGKRALGDLRYQFIQKEVGFDEKISTVLKMEFSKNSYKRDGHRVFVSIIDGNPQILKILFLDPFHLVASSAETRGNSELNYEDCFKTKNDCISKVKL